MGLMQKIVAILALGVAGAMEDDIVVGQTFLAGSTDPTSGSTAWALTSHGISENLFTVDQNGEIVPQVAESVGKVSENVWDVTLKSDYYFSDGTAVTAEAVAACLSELNAENPSAQSSLGAMTVTATSDSVVRIESERVTHVMDAVLAEWVFAIYKRDGEDFVFTGPYAVEAFMAGDQIDLVPNAYYPGAADRPHVVVKQFQDGYALAAGFEEGAVDVGFHLPIDTLADVRAMDGASVKTFEVGYHYMMFHNLEREAMQDLRVRQAIDLALDRHALSQALAGGHPTRSLFPDYSPYYNEFGDAHGDAAAAAALLDDAGYPAGADGSRGLSVRLVAYPHRPGLVIMQPVITDTLESLGIAVDDVLTGMDWQETQDIMDAGDYDLLMWAQNTLPAGDPGWFLNAFFRTDGGNNHMHFASTAVDGLLDTLEMADEHSARVQASNDVQAGIQAEMPISNLVTPAWHVGLSSRMAGYEPWGSDYYVIRSDLRVTHEAHEEEHDDHDGHDHGADEEEEHDDHDGHDHGADEEPVVEESDGAAKRAAAAAGLLGAVAAALLL